MTIHNKFSYTPNDYELERASNSYLMSLIAIMAGLPLPIINLIAISIFYFGNRKGTDFVRWHCTQTLLSHIVILVMNCFGYYWTLSIIFGSNEVTNPYIAYMITICAYNLTEFIVTIYTAIQTRKGRHINWWFFGTLTNLLFKR
jgi:hypothetical protein